MFSSLSHVRLGPPRSPRNSFFPWHNMSVHRTGKYLEANKLILKVPINLTKFEIRNYVQQIYGAKVMYVNTLIRIPDTTRVKAGRFRGKWYRSGPTHKRAFLVTEFPIPDEVKMLRSSKDLHANPDILKNSINWGIWPNARLRKPGLPDKPGAWRHPLPKLLAPEEMELNSKLRINENETMMAPDLNKPFSHSLGPFSPAKGTPEGIPEQEFKRIDLYPWRKRFAALKDSGVLHPAGASAGVIEGVPTHPKAHLLYGDKKPKPAEPSSAATRKLKPTPSPWRVPY